MVDQKKKGNNIRVNLVFKNVLISVFTGNNKYPDIIIKSGTQE